jgi:chromosome segregation ATPase
MQELRSEIASLRGTLETESARSAALESALQDAREAIAALNGAHQSTAEQLRRVEEQLCSVEEALGSATAETRRNLEEIERKTPDPNRLLRLETRVDQQAEDIRTAIAGLVTRIDELSRTSKSS